MSEVDKIYDYCCRLLKIRDRSIYEIKNKLASKGIPEKIISSVVKKLIDNNFLSEQRFVENYIWKNLTKCKSLTLILLELKEKYKVQDNTLQSLELEKYKQQQYSYAAKYIKKKYKDLNTQKVYNLLISKGFNDEEVEKIISLAKNL